MNIQEMHIGIDLQLQKVNSNIISYIKPEEKDVFLYQEVLRYISQRLNPKNNESKGIEFEGTSKRYEDLKGLLEHTPTPLPVYYRDGRSVFTYLPSNCLRLINDRSFTKDLCGQEYNPTTIIENIYYTSFKLPTVAEAFSYINFKISINSVVIFNINNYPQFLPEISSDKATFQLISFILEALRDAGYEAAYENYLDLFKLSSIIIKSTIPIVVALTGADSSPTSDDPIANYNSSIRALDKIVPVSSIERENILTKTEDIYKLLDSSFGTTKAQNPLSTLERGRLNIYHNKKFIVSSVNLDFIRIPRKISLSLNQSCDLDPSVHEEIVDNVVKRLAGITTAANYQLLMNENNIKE